MSGNNLSTGTSGSEVAALHASLKVHGLDVVTTEIQGQSFGPSTEQAVRAFQSSHSLPVTGVVDDATAAALGAAPAPHTDGGDGASHGTQATGVTTTTSGGGSNVATVLMFSVSGQIYSVERSGLGSLQVQIVDKNVGQDIPLAEGVSAADGTYALQYPMTAFRQRGKAAPDIQAVVSKGGTVLATSEVRYNATATETLDVLLSDSASAALPSEYETLTAKIAQFYQGQLGALQETDGRSDITYLANKTEWDARQVAMAALADQFSQSVPGRVPPFVFYALFRAGLPPSEDVLYRLDANTLISILETAVNQGVIPAFPRDMFPRIMQQFQAIAAQKLLTMPALTGTSPLKDMLALAQLNDAQQQQFATLYVTQRTDPATFWKAVTDAVGPDNAKRLQVQGKLALLTVNNAPLMQALDELGDPLQLVQAGYHRSAKWNALLTANIPIPPQMPGDTADAKRAYYATYLAALLRLLYPTAAVAEMVKSGDLHVDTPDQVQAFLTAHQDAFEIGVQPVEQYITRNRLTVDPAVVTQVKRLQRVYQLTPHDQAMGVLLDHHLDAAYHIVQYDRQTFVASFGPEMGGTEIAMQVYDRSVQIHGAVLNVAIHYLTARNGLPLGATPLQAPTPAASAGGQPGGHADGQILRPAPSGPKADSAADLIAYPTLESLFGSMDFCSCPECRSLLSPAAYLVDLLQFIDRAADGKENAQAVLFERRPDIQYLPLTCENTNTAMPYIDLVNETLEYYVANTVKPLSLEQYAGHDTSGTASEDLLASPQFVLDAAYTLLRGEWFPSPLPFHQPLENLRRYFATLGVPLQVAMERLRQSDELERGGNPYAWRDILMEELGLSREEYRLLTDSTLTLKQIYGFSPATSDSVVSDTLSNARQFARRVGVSYDDLVSILRTRFVNPNSDLVPKLEQLGVAFADMQALYDGTMNDADFLKLLPTGAGAPDPAEYGGDIVAWVKNPDNYARIMGIITLTDPTGGADGCAFDQFELRYSRPTANATDESTRLGTVEFVRLLRFIRLWQKTGWTIEDTDAAICALYRADLAPVGQDNVDTVAKLDAGFLTLLPRLGVAVRVLNALGLTPQHDLPPLLACWSDIGTHADNALYRQMFLNPVLQDPAFADNGYGEFLTDGTQKLLPHAETLRGAFNLTADELDRIVAALGYDNNTPLTLTNISAIYRHGWLARTLRLSVRELLLFVSLTGLDPFAAPDIGIPPAAEPPISRLIGLIQALRDRSLKSAVALYLIWNQDLSGKSAPDPAQVTAFARTLRADFASIDDQFAATQDPGGDILRARMALVYGQEPTDAFFALLDNTLILDVPYTHPAPALEPAIVAADPNLAYDDFRHRLSHTGIVSADKWAALKALPGVPSAFQDAVDALFAQSQDALGSFFSQYPELKPLYDSYVASTDPLDKKRAALLAAFQPELSRRRKREQALQRLSAAVGLDLAATQALLDPVLSPGAAYPLHAAGHSDRPVLNDVLALETPGLAAQFFYRDTATGAVDLSVPAADNLDYSASAGNPLPANSTPGAAISGIWQGSLEIPEAGYYNIIIETDAGATARLSLGGQPQPLTQNGTIWRNSNPLQLSAGTLYDIVLTVEKVKDSLSVEWETQKRPREVLPGRYLYPPSVLPPFRDAYVRFLKAVSIATGLGLTASEVAHFGADPDYRIAGDGWLNVLPTTGDPDAATASALLTPFLTLLDFARIKADWSPDDERVLTVLQDPGGATVQPDSLLFTLSRWAPSSLTDMLTHFAGTVVDLSHFALFRRVYDAFSPVQAMAIPAAKLIQATTNEPTGSTVRDLQGALRARYAADDWRNIIRPINDAMRELQRDALVTYVLHQMRENPATAQIDTADKLFEYFLMDVEMEACMQTSRIRHALSSVQLFIDRCLMNLEARVSPKSIDAEHWAWMKRYRIWEANRKVFLFPENWLEPELRDDKSPFFKEIESELLESDITDDTATTALLNYLAKLHDIAKLEPCGMYLAEGDGGPAGDVVHVVARSSGAHRNYYYRRYEYGYWTPWEQIKLDIEDNPVIPVVWNNRLLLFWLRILRSGPDTVQKPFSDNLSDPHLTALQTTDIKTDPPQVTVNAVLCWSEYYNGKWQATKTSDPSQPVALGQFAPSGDFAFNRSNLRLFSDELQDGLRITIWGGNKQGAFLLYNTHSLPLPTVPSPALGFGMLRGFNTSTPTFAIDYDDRFPDVPDNPFSRNVLTDRVPDYEAVQPNHHVSDIWDAPFFFEDRKNVFYVTSEEQRVWVRGFGGYGISVDPGLMNVAEIPPLVTPPFPPPRSRPWADGALVGLDPGVIDPAPMQRFVTEDAYIRQGLATTATVAYGDRQIGPLGAITNGKVDVERG